MIIKSIIVKNFLGVPDGKYELSKNLTVLFGENMSGKTSLAMSIPFCFYGKTLEGKPNVIKNGEHSCCVIVEFIHDDGILYTVERSQITNDGSISTKSKIYSNTKDDADFSIIPEYDNFMSAFFPSYFTDILSYDEKRNIILSAIKSDIPDDEIAKKIFKDSDYGLVKSIIGDINESSAQIVKSKLDSKKIEIERTQSSIETLKKEKDNVAFIKSTNVGNVEKLNEANKAMQLNEMKNRLESAKNFVLKSKTKSYNDLKEEITKTENKLEELNKLLLTVNDSISKANSKIEIINKTISTLCKTGSNCVICDSKIDDEKRKSIISLRNKEKEQICSITKNNNESKIKIEKDVKTLKMYRDEIYKKFLEIESTNRLIKQIENDITWDEDNAKKYIQEYEKQYQEHIRNETLIDESEKRIKDLDKRILETVLQNENKIEELKNIELCYTLLKSIKPNRVKLITDLINKTISEYCNSITIETSKYVKKTDDFTDSFDIYFDGINYKSLYNGTAKLLVQESFSSLFSDIFNIPRLVEGSEVVDNSIRKQLFPKSKNQIIVTRFKEKGKTKKTMPKLFIDSFCKEDQVTICL